jgi:hypothetical protein
MTRDAAVTVSRVNGTFPPRKIGRITDVGRSDQGYGRLMKTAAITLGLLLGLGVLASPAAADVPSNVHGQQSGVVGVGWVRVLCASDDDGVKCAIRVPDGYSRMDLDFRGRGGYFLNERSWATPSVKPQTGPRRSFASRRVAPGVQVSCESRGNLVSCDFVLAARISNLNLTRYSAGSHQGGFVDKGF